MRFAGAVSILTLSLASAASAQDAAGDDQKLKDLQRDLQKQISDLQAQIDAMKAQPAAPAPAADGTVRQSPAEPAAEPRRLNISAPGIEGIDLFGGIGVRADYWGNYNATGSGSNDILSVGEEAWLGAKAKISEKTTAGVTLHFAGVWGNNTFNGLDSANGRLNGETGTATSTSNTANVSVTEAWLTVKDMYSTGIDFTAGRQKIQFGSERIIGDDEWRLNRTVFDGFRLDQSLGSDLGGWSFIAVRLADGDNLGSTELTPTSGNKVNNTDLFGLYYTIKRNDVGTIDAYVFQLEDMNYDANNVTASDRTRWTTYGARWLSNSFGGATFEAEGATQFGEFDGVDTHNYGFGTYALHLGANWSPEQKIEFFKAAHVAYDYASGGSDLTDNFVQLYPTLHGTFGITDFFSWTNIEHWMLGADFDALDGTVSLNYHTSRMASKNSGFIGYNAAGAPGTASSKELGQEFDLVYSVDCTKSTKVGMGIGYFFPGSGFHDMTGAANDMVYGFLSFRVIF